MQDGSSPTAMARLLNAGTAGVIAEILAQARAGAHEKAWTLFARAGLEARRDDPAVLSLHGRLLKDRGRRSVGDARRRDYLAAAAAYSEAASIDRSTYPLINAATLSLLAGDALRAQALAAETLALLDVPAPNCEPETPYFLRATRAEAMLLLGRRDEAEHWLGEAVGAAPAAWEDHATTLRQFGMILAAMSAPATWLDPFRPPRSLHFAGEIHLPADVDSLSTAISAWIAAERIGFAHGALAAGADILIAEAIIAAGAELHVTLPAPRDAFIAASVRPFGEMWEPRFERLMAAATSVREIDENVPAAAPAAIALSDVAAMGGAVMQSRDLQSEALQLVVDRGGRHGSNSDRLWRLWGAAGRRQRRITLPASRGGAASPPPSDNCEITAVLALGIGTAKLSAPLLHAVADAMAKHRPTLPPVWVGQTLLLSYPDAMEAWTAAGAIAPRLTGVRNWRMAAYLGLAERIDDPVTDGMILSGSATARVMRILSATPDRTLLISDLMAAALAIASPAGTTAEPVGELAADAGNPEMPLFALRL